MNINASLCSVPIDYLVDIGSYLHLIPRINEKEKGYHN